MDWGKDDEGTVRDSAFGTVAQCCRALMVQYIRPKAVSTTSNGIAPVVPILLCAPKYVAGGMSLGEVMQAASAFLIVQTAFSWIVDNYPRLADWSASAGRLASLLVSLDRVERAEDESTVARITPTEGRRRDSTQHGVGDLG